MTDNSEINSACEILRKGGLVAFPTETVYGLGADATNASAVLRIFTAKGRPSTNPLIVHIAGVNVARRYAAEWPADADRLTAAFWPGPLALIVPKSPVIVSQATAGRSTVALRAPDHPVAQQLLQAFDGPIAAPSANRSTRISPTTAEHVRREVAGKVDAILDGGPCRVGIESTVLDLTSTIPLILRPGAISRQQIESVIGPVDLFRGKVDESKSATSPGQQAVHYSPQKPAVRFEAWEMPSVLDRYSSVAEKKIAILLRREEGAPEPLNASDSKFIFMAMPMAAEEYARKLYAILRQSDETDAIEHIAIELPPDEPQWTAVRDRIMRATRAF